MFVKQKEEIKFKVQSIIYFRTNRQLKKPGINSIIM